MSKALENYEQVSIYQLDPEIKEQLLREVRECTFNWVTKDDYPMGVIHSCLWHDGSLWMTCGAHRHRVSAIRRNPKSAVVLTSRGTSFRPGKHITLKGRITIHDDEATKQWFYKDFAHHLNPDDPAKAEKFRNMLNSPMRIVLELKPEKFITYDGAKMAAHTAGTIDESELAEPLESDRERFVKEAERRGLK